MGDSNLTSLRDSKDLEKKKDQLNLHFHFYQNKGD